MGYGYVIAAIESVVSYFFNTFTKRKVRYLIARQERFFSHFLQRCRHWECRHVSITAEGLLAYYLYRARDIERLQLTAANLKCRSANLFQHGIGSKLNCLQIRVVVASILTDFLDSLRQAKRIHIVAIIESIIIYGCHSKFNSTKCNFFRNGDFAVQSGICSCIGCACLPCYCSCFVVNTQNLIHEAIYRITSTRNDQVFYNIQVFPSTLCGELCCSTNRNVQIDT